MDAGVVEFDALTNSVRSTTQDQHRRFLSWCDLVLQVVAAVVVRSARGEFGSTGIHGLVDRPHAESPADSPYHVLAQVAQACDLGVGEAVPLRRPQQLRTELRRRLDHGSDV